MLRNINVSARKCDDEKNRRKGKKAAAAKTIRRNILFVNTFSGGEVETICAPEGY
jgi:hypothetical protein